MATKRPRLTMLKPRIATLNTGRVAPLKTRSASLRWSGRKLQEWRERILAREPLCRHCNEVGRTTIATEVDHIVPLEDRGTYEDSNAQPLCGDCHKAKTAKDRGYKPKLAGG
jgi:5-methylcytosine-specific restriction enzyme A